MLRIKKNINLVIIKRDNLKRLYVKEKFNQKQKFPRRKIKLNFIKMKLFLKNFPKNLKKIY